jgi:hypothetical protein
MAPPSTPSSSASPLDATWLSKPVTVPVALLLFMVGGGATFLGFPARGETTTREEVKEMIEAQDKLNQQRYDEILRRLDRMELSCGPAER